MIIGFAGTPGSGKTYEAVKKIIDNLMTGRVVYTNIEGLDDGECKEMIKAITGLSDLAIVRQLKVLEEDQLEEFWMHIEPGCLVVIDEVQKYFSSRDWQSEKNKIFGYWASTHRHNGFDVVLITQSVERVDTAVRSLFEWTYVFRKINFFGGAVQKKYMCYSYGGDDTRGPALAKSVRKYNDQIFLCYKSYVAKDVKELGIMQHVNVLKHPVFFAIPVVLFFTLYMIFGKSSFMSGDLFGHKAAMAKYENSEPKKGNEKTTTDNQISESFSKNTPNIQTTLRDGQILFTNRSKYTEKKNEKSGT